MSEETLPTPSLPGMTLQASKKHPVGSPRMDQLSVLEFSQTLACYCTTKGDADGNRKIL